MKKSLKTKAILACLASSMIFQACTTQQAPSPTVSSTSPSASPSAIETSKPVESVTPSSTPSVIATASPIATATPVISAIPSVIASVAPAQPKTYLVPLSLDSGKGTAYLTLSSDTSGKILVNFQDINDAPTKINLIDQSGNNILTSNSFTIAMSGNFSASFFKQNSQLIKKLQLFFANGKIIESNIDDSFLSTSPEATPIPPNPTPTTTVKTTELPNNYPHTYIPAGLMVSTFAGSGVAGYLDATGTDAQFRQPEGIAIDSTGNIFVADTANHRIRKITSAGVVTTVAGSGISGFADATGTSAQFAYPRGIAVDSTGNLFVADGNNNKIRKITPAGVVTTFAGSTFGFTNATGTSAKFDYPTSITVDSTGNLFVADSNNNTIRKITPAGVVTTFAGNGSWGFTDGTGTSAKFNYPTGITIDTNDNLFVADSSNCRIRKITPAGVVTTIAGDGSWDTIDGTGTSAKFDYPTGITIDSTGNLFVSQSPDNMNYSYKVRKITPAGVVTSIAGSSTSGYLDGLSSQAKFSWSNGIAVDNSGTIFVSDSGNNRIRKIK